MTLPVSIAPEGQINVLTPAGFQSGCWRLQPPHRWAAVSQADAVSQGGAGSKGGAGAVDQPEMPGAGRVVAKTLSAGLQQGVQVVRVTTSRCDVEVVLSRGGGIGYLAFDGKSVGWRSPVPGPVHPNFVPLYRPDGLGWLAGFDEVLARCGLFNVGGPQFNAEHQLVHPLHGDVAHWPCQSAAVRYLPDSQQLAVETSTDMVLFHFHRLTLKSSLRVSLVAPQIEVVDTIVNTGGRPADIMLLHHWNFGPPVADGGSRLEVPYREVSPRNPHAAAAVANWDTLDPPQAGSEETVYFLTPQPDHDGRGHALLAQPNAASGLHLTWDMSTMPYLTLWKNPVAEADGYAVGIEPGTCYPNGRDHESAAGRLRRLPPGDSLQIHVALTGLPSADAVQSARQAMRVHQTTDATVFRSPQAKFGPV
jgi:hypothetical protein